MKNKIIITSGITILIIILGILYGSNINKKNDDFHLDLIEDNILSNDEDEKEINKEINKQETLIYIHLCGAVSLEGVYEVEEGTRLFEVIKLANGLKDDAAKNHINQAMILQDGQKVYIPTNKELEDLDISFTTDAMNSEKDNLININTADIKELMTIPGIGEAKAKSIIEYREKVSKFNHISDIMKISGIKQGLFDKASPYIVVK